MPYIRHIQSPEDLAQMPTDALISVVEGMSQMFTKRWPRAAEKVIGPYSEYIDELIALVDRGVDRHEIEANMREAAIAVISMMMIALMRDGDMPEHIRDITGLKPSDFEDRPSSNWAPLVRMPNGGLAAIGEMEKWGDKPLDPKRWDA